MSEPAERKAAGDFIASAKRLYDEGRNETVLIRNLIAYLPRMFPEGTLWIAHHVRDAESQVAYGETGGSRRAFIDSLVGYTTIEYERDLTNNALFATGYNQVRQHAAGLLNQGAPTEKILGILSDTLRWRAYRISEVRVPAAGPIGPDDVDLEQIDELDLSAAVRGDGERAIDFLGRYLGREAARRLAADTIAFDLGFESEFGKKHLAAIQELVANALDERPEYAAVVQRLWKDFVSYIGDTKSEFDLALYASELYVVTLAKLICANVVARGALHSEDAELTGILDGEHFRAKGLENLVEYDYFGWLNAEPYVSSLLPVAGEMQRSLRTYDFEEPAAEDLFGQLLAQLAKRSQRVLLGQEWTPPWLARRIAQRLIDDLPDDESPRFIDMCCGSGSMLVEAVKLARERLGSDATLDGTAIAELTQVGTGFDIDPLAVMLAKVNWVAASRAWLEPFDGSRRISIPIYLADSMFAKTPVGEIGEAGGDGSYELSLHDRALALPAFLVSPERRALFDSLLDRGYAIGMTAALEKDHLDLDASDVGLAVTEACSDSSVALTDEQHAASVSFLSDLIAALEQLQRDELNGIWAFVLRNSYRPGLVIGQFNGLISNPPWLALSKFADNPYRDVLRREAEAYGIKAPGAAHLHVELATTFLLHAVDHYLRDGAVIGCVLPEPIINGVQHEPFRRAAYKESRRPVRLAVKELWRVASGTFKNEAVVLIATREEAEPPTSFPGALVGEASVEPRTFRVIEAGSVRTAWSDADADATSAWFDDIQFRQGADVMPRTAVFHEVDLLSGDRARLRPIDRSTSDLAYLVDDVKKMKTFKITPTTIPSRFLFDVLLSKQLVPFHLGVPAKGLLPFERDGEGVWGPVPATRLAASPPAKAAFAEILKELANAEGHAVTVSDFFEAVDTPRRKLSIQRLPDDGYLVVFGAGGSFVSAAYAALADFDVTRLVIDQTLYWMVAASEDEAVYITGLFNSPALDRIIAEFQPQGQFGRRHIHELPTLATPGYDASDPTHAAVVEATRNLMAEFEAIRDDSEYERLFSPAVNLSSRRRTLRAKVIPTLPSYAQYVEACGDLYAGAKTPGSA